jgi:hypothetical protein|tara:strand:- start:2919 stop:3152 length:234 start_codon:yes stop_codon:yes gene_type:complete
MRVRTTYELTLEVTVSGTYHPPVAEQGPTYNSGGQPAEPATIEDLLITLNGIEQEVDDEATLNNIREALMEEATAYA